MKNLTIIALVFFSFCSSSQSVIFFDLPRLEKIAQLSSIEPPPAIASMRVYVIGANDSISECNFVRLQDVYKSLYTDKYSKFSTFLFDALNQKIRLDTRNFKTALYYSQNFEIAPNINGIYNEKGFNGLIQKFCVDKEGFYSLNSSTLNLSEINSISYYLFLNQYMRLDDDYEGTIAFKKLTSLIN